MSRIPVAPAPTSGSATVEDLDARRADRAAQRARHVQSLSRLMAARGDLHGVTDFADLVVDSVSWTA